MKLFESIYADSNNLVEALERISEDFRGEPEEKIEEIVSFIKHAYRDPKFKLEFIGNGVCRDVYDIGNDRVLKLVNRSNRDISRSFQSNESEVDPTMRAILDGFIPEIYEYDKYDYSWLITEKCELLKRRDDEWLSGVGVEQEDIELLKMLSRKTYYQLILFSAIFFIVGFIKKKKGITSKEEDKLAIYIYEKYKSNKFFSMLIKLINSENVYIIQELENHNLGFNKNGNPVILDYAALDSGLVTYRFADTVESIGGIHFE